MLTEDRLQLKLALRNLPFYDEAAIRTLREFEAAAYQMATELGK